MASATTSDSRFSVLGVRPSLVTIRQSCTNPRSTQLKRLQAAIGNESEGAASSAHRHGHRLGRRPLLAPHSYIADLS